ncbi:MAG: ABC transporter substrate-binding protein [Chloroflexi bacterium]|nr:ABC transporter substrate-binding protein [Chloroflexota bacterium]
MTKKGVWLVVSGLMVLSLVLASCAPKVTEEKKVVTEEKKAVTEEKKVVPPVTEESVAPKATANVVQWMGKKLDGTAVEKMLEKPRYGGVYAYAREAEPVTFEDLPLGHVNAWAINPTNEELIQKDWTRGPGGTGEWSAAASYPVPLDMRVGWLAESWEIASDTITFRIRRGINWQDKPPVNGRELTADDVVFSLRREFGGNLGSSYGLLADMKNPENSIYVSPTDRWAVVLKVQPPYAGTVFDAWGDQHAIIPREVVETYKDMNDWRNVVGSGPFILKDYVRSSVLTYVRNPLYWRPDPFFPENRLPYIDTLKAFIIPDASTRLAGLRTGKIDSLDSRSGLAWEDTEPVLKTNPELEWRGDLNAKAPVIFMRVDKPELPFYDVRVRQALHMAINDQEMQDKYYAGQAGFPHYPVTPVPDLMDVFVPLKELPQSIREIYEYHPDKAAKLLAEAGYPKGFSTEIATKEKDVDLLSIIKAYWAKIGVDLKIDVKEYAAHEAMGPARSYSQMFMENIQSGNPFTLSSIRPGSRSNRSGVADPKVTETYVAINAASSDEPKKRQILRDFVPYIHEQQWLIVLPAPHIYTLWQPWLKGYYGANDVSSSNTFGHPAYIWIDQDLKKKMGH